MVYKQYKKIERTIEKELKALSINAQVYSIKFMGRRFINVDFNDHTDMILYKVTGTTSLTVDHPYKDNVKADIRYRVLRE